MGLELEVAPEGLSRPEHTEIHLDHPSSPTILARPQLPYSSPFSAPITLPLSAR
jgi:hypothetical protein